MNSTLYVMFLREAEPTLAIRWAPTFRERPPAKTPTGREKKNVVYVTVLANFHIVLTFFHFQLEFWQVAFCEA